MLNKQPEGFITRHSLKPTQERAESVAFPGIAEEGVELARERAKDIAKLVEAAAPGTIIFQGGVSTEVRTRSTMQVYGDALKERFEGREDVIVISRDELSESAKAMGFTKTADTVVRRAEADPEAKVVIDLPLRLTEMIGKGWFTESGGPTPYVDHIFEGEATLFEAEVRWLREQGRIDGVQVGPNPVTIAENLLDALGRLRDFVHRFFPNRPVLVGCVGHSFEIDALLAYINGQGQISADEYTALQSDVINETEMITFALDGDDVVAGYRGMEMRLPPVL